MATAPAKCLFGTFSVLEPFDFVQDSNDPYVGFPRKWKISVTVESQAVSAPGEDGDFSYNAFDIKKGDWIASLLGISVQVSETPEFIDPFNATVIVEDVDNFNINSDKAVAGTGIGFDGPCIVFELGINQLPVIGPMPTDTFPATFQGDVISRFVRTLDPTKSGGGGGGGGGSDVLTDTSDSSAYDDGYIKGWQVGFTKVSDAFRMINLALKDLTPPAPPNLNIQYLNVEGGLSLVDGNPIVLAVSALNSTGLPDASLPRPGSPIRRVIKSTFNTTEIGPFAPGNRGELTLLHNTETKGMAELDTGSNVGSYDALEITTDTAFPANKPGFHEALTARGVAMVPVEGVNCVQIAHSEGTSSPPEFFVYSTSTTLPTIDSINVDVAESSVLISSSGIPHLARGSSLTIAGSVSDLATDITFDRKNIDIFTTPVAVGPTTWLSPGSKGLKANFVKGGTDSFSNANYDIADTENNPAYGTVDLKIVARNPNGVTEYVHSKRINVMRGGVPVGVGPLDELSVPVLDLGELVEGKPLFGFRVELPNEFTPDAAFTDMPPLWDSTIATPDWEASVVGGAAIADLNNYADFIPPGPDYSAKFGTQYITFAVCRSAVSRMIVQVRGSFSKMLVKLPGLTDLPLAANGWWDAALPYEGAGVPGRAVSAGCALGLPAFGFDQDVHVTFGSENSANANNNLILVRFMLVGDNRITGLRFTGAR